MAIKSLKKTRATCDPLTPPLPPEPATTPEPVVPPTPVDVSFVAFLFFMERGGKHGHALEDWLRAELLLREST
jgi:hypothetical protein